MKPKKNDKNNANAVSAKGLCKKHDCISFEDFDDALNHEIMKQFAKGGSQ